MHTGTLTDQIARIIPRPVAEQWAKDLLILREEGENETVFHVRVLAEMQKFHFEQRCRLLKADVDDGILATTAWGSTNQRRASLIMQESLSPEESVELEALQRIADLRIQLLSPRDLDGALETLETLLENDVADRT